MPGSLITPPRPILAPLAPLEPEPLRVVAVPHVFDLGTRRILQLPQGLRLHEILAEAGIPPTEHVRVWVDDWLIPREMWHVVRPRAGRLVTARVVPMGGGGGNNTGKLIGRIAIVLALT